MIKKIDAKQLQINMFVCDTDRKWLELPFFRRKFLVTSSEQINIFREYCKFVYINTEKGVDTPEDKTIIEQEMTVDTEPLAQYPYPSGCVVELNTGAIAIVTRVHPKNRLQPILSMVTNAQKQLLTQEVAIDLANQAPQDLEIIQTLAIDDPIVELLRDLHKQAL